MKRALVIGGTGFIGLHVVDELLAAGCEVAVTRRKRSFTMWARQRPITLVAAELEDTESLVRAMTGMDCVFFCAGYYPRYSLDLAASTRAALAGIRNVLEAARVARVGRVVYTSTTGTLCGESGSTLDESSRCAVPPADSVYRHVKCAMEAACDEEVARGAVDVVTLLPGGCIGPGDLHLGTAGLLVGTATGTIPWRVEGIVNLADVRDVAHAHVVAARTAARGARYCLGGHSLLLSEVMRAVVERYGGAMPSDVLEPAAARARADKEERSAAKTRARVAFPREFVDIVLAGRSVSSARAEQELGITWRPLAQSIDDAMVWLTRHGFLRRPRDERASRRPPAESRTRKESS